MKKIYYILSLALATGFMASCSNDLNGTDELLPTDQTEVFNPTATRAFPEDDGAKPLPGEPAQQLYTLLGCVDSSFTHNFMFDMPKAQYEEIKEKADELVEGKTTTMAKYRAIFNWIKTNIKYNDTNNPNYSNEPYEVFINKICICQGYANLLNVMLYSQNIPVINTNGYYRGMGHAWNYVYHTRKWYLSDPTGGSDREANEYSSYQLEYIPVSCPGNVLVTDEFAFNYSEQALNLNEVISAPDAMAVPFSATFSNGKKYMVTSFNPTVDLPSNVREIYFGTNIKSLGIDNTIGLREHAPSVEAAYVDEANTELQSHAGVVYYKKDNVPLYIPAAMTKVSLLPTEVMDKEHVVRHNGIEELYVAEGTKKIEDWAVENCPNLKVAYVPTYTEISENAFTGVHESFQIIRQDMTGIKDVIAD